MDYGKCIFDIYLCFVAKENKFNWNRGKIKTQRYKGERDTPVLPSHPVQNEAGDR